LINKLIIITVSMSVCECSEEFSCNCVFMLLVFLVGSFKRSLDQFLDNSFHLSASAWSLCWWRKASDCGVIKSQRLELFGL